MEKALNFFRFYGHVYLAIRFLISKSKLYFAQIKCLDDCTRKGLIKIQSGNGSFEKCRRAQKLVDGIKFRFFLCKQYGEGVDEQKKGMQHQTSDFIVLIREYMLVWWILTLKLYSTVNSFIDRPHKTVSSQIRSFVG